MLGVSSVCMALVVGCSGSVVFVEDDGSGDGGANAGGFAQGPGNEGGAPAPPSPATGGAPPSATGGAPPTPPADGGAGGGSQVPRTECGIACEVLFECGFAPSFGGGSLCPGLEPNDQVGFSNFCVPQCEAQPGGTSFIDASDCEGTVALISAVSPTYADLCAFGL
jgi:hypothetical protein